MLQKKRDVPGLGYAALMPNWNGSQAFAVSLQLNQEIARNWMEFLQKRYSKDMDALQRSMAIKSPAEFASFAFAFWQEAAKDYFSELGALQKILLSGATIGFRREPAV
ncbi:MAG: phasin family protein [Proteobacteria bacterium]|nr:phasin family protein [Pseudomonadota bacterium]